MALIKYKDLAKMAPKDREEKMKDLKMELIKSNVTANRSNGKTKEIKRAIARLLTFSNNAGEAKNK